MSPEGRGEQEGGAVYIDVHLLSCLRQAPAGDHYLMLGDTVTTVLLRKLYNNISTVQRVLAQSTCSLVVAVMIMSM